MGGDGLHGVGIKEGTVEVPAYACRPDGCVDLPWEWYGPERTLRDAHVESGAPGHHSYPVGRRLGFPFNNGEARHKRSWGADPFDLSASHSLDAVRMEGIPAKQILLSRHYGRHVPSPACRADAVRRALQSPLRAPEGAPVDYVPAFTMEEVIENFCRS